MSNEHAGENLFIKMMLVVNVVLTIGYWYYLKSVVGKSQCVD